MWNCGHTCASIFSSKRNWKSRLCNKLTIISRFKVTKHSTHCINLVVSSWDWVIVMLQAAMVSYYCSCCCIHNVFIHMKLHGGTSRLSHLCQVSYLTPWTTVMWYVAPAILGRQTTSYLPEAQSLSARQVVFIALKIQINCIQCIFTIVCDLNEFYG